MADVLSLTRGKYLGHRDAHSMRREPVTRMLRTRHVPAATSTDVTDAVFGPTVGQLGRCGRRRAPSNDPNSVADRPPDLRNPLCIPKQPLAQHTAYGNASSALR